MVAISNLPPMTVFFVSSSNRVYTLRRTVGFIGDEWSNVAGQLQVRGSGGKDMLQDTNVLSGSRFYRLSVEMP